MNPVEILILQSALDNLKQGNYSIVQKRLEKLLGITDDEKDAA